MEIPFDYLTTLTLGQNKALFLGGVRLVEQP